MKTQTNQRHDRASTAANHRAYVRGDQCPNCDAAKANDIEDNGCTGEDRTFLCTKCHHQWDAETYRD